MSVIKSNIGTNNQGVNMKNIHKYVLEQEWDNYLKIILIFLQMWQLKRDGESNIFP